MNIGGATGATYTINSVQAIHAGTYRVAITNASGGTTHSSSSVLNVTGGAQPPVITTDPLSALVNADANHTLSVQATGTGLNYQWKRNEIDIAGANDANYTITGFNLQHEGTYRCVVSNPDGNSSSNDAMLFRRPIGTDVSAPDSWPFIYQDSFTPMNNRTLGNS